MAAPSVDSPKHRKLVEFVRTRREYARRFFVSRHDRWREAEKHFRGFVEPKKATDPNVPWLRKLFVPVTPLLVQTQLSFDVAAFTQNQPVARLDGVGPEDVKGVKPMEAYLEWEWRTRLMLKELYGWLLDRRRYGVGILWNRWTQDVGFRTRREQRMIEMPLLGIRLKGPEEKVREQFIRYEGNDAQVQDPFDFGFDPRVTAARVHEGEFVYRFVRRSFSYMKEQEKADPPFYTNVDAIPESKTIQAVGSVNHRGEVAGFTRHDHESDSSRHDIVGLTRESHIAGNTADPIEKGFVELTEMVARLIPRDYEIGPEDEPTLYWITLANDTVVVRAEPYDFDHQQYPVSIVESHPDPHSALNISSVEEMAELQKFANWLYRSHAEHVIRTLNGQFLVDPSKIHIEDLLNPQPGNLVRIKPDAFQIPGGLRDAFQQLQVQDVTKGHLGEIQNILSFLERLSGATENLQGVAAPGETTLGEQQMANQAATGRLRISAQLAWNQGMVPWLKQRIANAQQLMDQERFVRIVGGLQDDLELPPDQRFVKVYPGGIAGEFDVMPIDGLVRGDGQLLQAWTQIFTQLVNSPAMSQMYDITGIFRYIAMLSGVKNLNEFQLKRMPSPVEPVPGAEPGGVQVIGDEQAQRAVEAGNLVPAEEMIPGGMA